MNQNSKKPKTIAIYSMKLAGILMQNSYVLLSMDRNLNGSGKNVFYFNDSPELQQLIAEYKASSKG